MGDQKDVSQPDDVQAKAGVNLEASGIEDHVERTVGKNAYADIMAALNKKEGNWLNTLPSMVKRNVKALKKLQMEYINIEVDFFKEVHELEVKYEKKFGPLYEQRRQIVNGLVTPDEECDCQSDSEEIEISNGILKLKFEESADDEAISDIKGIPDFWLTAFKNAPAVSDMIEEHDEPILKHLTDVKCVTLNEPMGFYLEFHFEPNDHFPNAVLTKSYELICAPDPGDVFSFDGPEIVKCKGCTIDWKTGKNVTVKTMKQKRKSRGAFSYVMKTVRNDSFFNFFNPPVDPEDEEEEDLLDADYEAGSLLKDKIIPRAVLYFTGENMVDDDDDDLISSSTESSFSEGDDDDKAKDSKDRFPNRKKSQ